VSFVLSDLKTVGGSDAQELTMHAIGTSGSLGEGGCTPVVVEQRSQKASECPI